MKLSFEKCCDISGRSKYIMWFIVLLTICVATGDALRLAAYISSGGLHGEIKFEPGNVENVKINFSLKTTLQYPDQLWEWSITQFPVDYTVTNDRCDEQNLGKSVIDLTELLGPLQMPGNETGSVEVPGLNLTGEKGLWGKGLVLRDTYSSKTICASITVLDRNAEKVSEARFHGPIAGTVWFRWLGGQAGENTTETIIHSNLHHVDQFISTAVDFTEHQWKIYVTDIFDPGKDKSNCNILQTVFDPDNAGTDKSIGDVDMRLGKIKVATNPTRKTKTFYRDPGLDLLPTDVIGSHRLLYLVLFHPNHSDAFLACAKIKYRRSILTKALINSHGIKGEVTFTQESPFDPTWLNISLNPVNDLETRLRYETKIAAYRIHELPEEPAKHLEEVDEPCTTTKKMYNPLNVDEKEVPPAGFGTQEQYAIGDLSGKLQGRVEGSFHTDILAGSAKLSGLYWDANLPLSGPHSIVHRSLVLHKLNETDNISIIPWVCGIIVPHLSKNAGPMPLTTAQVIFRYPLVGRIIFRQPTDEPEMDTTIIVENLVHADGTSLNNSAEHRWMIHDLPPGKDFYDWQNRCLSVGAPFNPHKIEWGLSQPNRCSSSEFTLCRLGDLTRLGTLEIAGRKIFGSKLTRKLFTDNNIPLSGYDSILGKSLVIYDDHGPKARGERLACSVISRVYRRKAVVKNWFGNGEDPTPVRGKLEFIQQSEYDVTDVEVNLEGLSSITSGYHIHVTPVEMDLEFPCEDSTLYGHWNPLKVNTKRIPLPEAGTTDQYEMGDLSGKFGTLDNKTRYIATYNDTLLPLFGPRSILGRSVVIHKKDRNLRWSCATVERGYAPSEARELRAIASFHHPNGYAYGYIRLTQLIYRDNSQSETIIEVKLRHPGENDRNITENHNWAIFVNPVGVDATVQVKETRCVAGGYIWNPFYTQLAAPLDEDLYRQECGPDLPLRCYVGDVSARLGPIDIGLERRVFTDSNFPLEGTFSAMGKSIVIMEKDFGGHRYACANIEPDHDIVKYANIRRPPRFVVAQFLEDVREVMGVPEWMVSVDSRKTKTLHNGGCVQFLLHFRGPIANKLDQDFSRLISTGKLASPSLYIPGYVPKKRRTVLGYRQCGYRDPNEKKDTKVWYRSDAVTRYPQLVLLTFILLYWLNPMF